MKIITCKRKPIYVEAVRLTNDMSMEKLYDWGKNTIQGRIRKRKTKPFPEDRVINLSKPTKRPFLPLLVMTPDGVETAQAGDWLVMDRVGDVWYMTDRIFHAFYDIEGEPE